MADPSQHPDDATQPSSDVGFTQGDIDALHQAGGAASRPSGDSGGAASAAGGGLDQNDLDALIDAAGAGGEVDAATQAAIEEEPSAAVAQPLSAGSAASPTHAQSFRLEDFEENGGEKLRHRITMLNDVELNVRIQLGQTRMLVEDVLQLDSGSVVELDKLAGDPVDVYVNERLVARGEVLVLNDNFCVRISDVLSRDPHRVIT